ncbi:hypothetical protein [Kutzneria kofuensis]|uniref:Uncharacterized protein YukE n=1 Tax=Kutzneria kofuensis TaxID=103725 RepID=A0A7W9KJ47_9PSEU|nr:hypothetical protein [Kutzneria kofuensis]MBB5893563.1 uncharacterized protein YukE [Kutzneria kofuensis]
MLAPDGGGAEGFAGAALGVAALEQNYVNLKGAVDSGQVSITPDAAANAAKACRDQKDDFVRFRDQAQQLARHAQTLRMGDCGEGISMRGAFQKKAEGGQNSAYDLFTQAAEIMENMAKAYEAAGKMYHETDQANAQAFKGKM